MNVAIKVRVFKDHKPTWKYIDEFYNVEVKGLLFRRVIFSYSRGKFKRRLKYNKYGYYFEFENANYYVEGVK